MSSNYKITLMLDLSIHPGRNLMRGIARYSRLHGPWQLNNIWSDLYDSKSRDSDFFKNLRKNLINSDGVIIREPAAWKYLEGIDIPMIVASAIKDVEIPASGTIMTDSRAIGSMGAGYFIQKGFKRVAFCGLKGMLWSTHRQEFFFETSKSRELEVFDYSFNYPKTEMQRESRINSLTKWIQKLPKPIGIMAANDLCGKLVLDACRNASVNVPQEVAVLGVDNDDIFCELTWPSLSSIELSTEKAGYESAALLEKILKGKKPRKTTIHVEPVVIKERRSTDIVAVEDNLVSEILLFIKENADKPLQSQDIVNAFNISRRSLYSKFKDTLGISIHKAIRKARVDRICKLLIESNLSIKEIAYQSGFADLDHVSRYFKKEKGVSPSQFRSRYS